jgi:hypothetical protein
MTPSIFKSISACGASQDLSPSEVVQALQTALTVASITPSVTMASEALAGWDIKSARIEKLSQTNTLIGFTTE